MSHPDYKGLQIQPAKLKITNHLLKAMQGIGQEEMQHETSQNQPVLNNAARSAMISNDRLSSLGKVLAFSSFSSIFRQQNSMYSTSMGRNWFTCPLTVPFCQRETCKDNRYNSGIQTNAFACYSKPGCCFDQVLYQHRLAFGPNFFKR